MENRKLNKLIDKARRLTNRAITYRNILKNKNVDNAKALREDAFNNALNELIHAIEDYGREQQEES